MENVMGTRAFATCECDPIWYCISLYVFTERAFSDLVFFVHIPFPKLLSFPEILSALRSEFHFIRHAIAPYHNRNDIIAMDDRYAAKNIKMRLFLFITVVS